MSHYGALIGFLRKRCTFAVLSSADFPFTLTLPGRESTGLLRFKPTARESAMRSRCDSLPPNTDGESVDTTSLTRLGDSMPSRRATARRMWLVLTGSVLAALI